MRQARGEAARPEFEIRSALGSRIAQFLLFSVGAFLAVVGTIALVGHGSLWAILAAAATVVWCTYFYRLIGLAVVAHEEVLEVRNLFITRRLDRASVRAVSLGKSTVAKSPNQTVVLELDSGRSIALDACARTLQSKRKFRRVEEFERRLKRWSGVDERPPSEEEADAAGALGGERV